MSGFADEELTRLARRVLEAAREGARVASQGFRRRRTVSHKSALELVTEHDLASEARVRELLAPLGIPLVGEEQGGEPPPAGPVFYVDPIDGTTNFVHGHPFWCVSIGLVIDGAPTLGVVVAPALGLAFAGHVAEDGARRATRTSAEGEESCSVSETSLLEDALLATGFPYDRRTSRDNNFDAFVAIKRRCHAVRRCGSAALDLCLVADGTYDGYWERKLRPWDFAGGAAIVRAAGGRVTDFAGGASLVPDGHLVVTNGRLHDELLAALGATRPGEGEGEA